MGSRGSARLLAAVLAMTERSMEMPNDASLASPIDSPITSSASTWGIGVSLGASTLSSCGRTVGNASTSHKMCCSCSRSWSSTSSPSSSPSISVLLAASAVIGHTGTRLLAFTISRNGAVASRSQGCTVEGSDPSNRHVTAATVTRSSGESESPPWSAPGHAALAAPGSAVILRSEWASVSHAGSADSASGGSRANIPGSGGP